MNIINQKILVFIIFLVLVFLFSPVFVSATVFQPSQPSGGGLPNPLGEGNVDPRVIIGNIIKAGLGIVGSLALATFILGGFFWVTSAGNEEKIKKGKDMILWASFGLAVIFFSYALVTFVINAVAGQPS